MGGLHQMGLGVGHDVGRMYRAIATPEGEEAGVISLTIIAGRLSPSRLAEEVKMKANEIGIGVEIHQRAAATTRARGRGTFHLPLSFDALACCRWEGSLGCFTFCEILRGSSNFGSSIVVLLQLGGAYGAELSELHEMHLH